MMTLTDILIISDDICAALYDFRKKEEEKIAQAAEADKRKARQPAAYSSYLFRCAEQNALRLRENMHLLLLSTGVNAYEKSDAGTV